MRRCLIVLLALSIPPAKGLSAQLPAERAAIEALRDSLAHVTDSLSLKGLEAATIQVAKQHRDDPLVHVRLGFIAHRRGEIANTKSHYDDAAGQFEWAAELRAGWSGRSAKRTRRSWRSRPTSASVATPGSVCSSWRGPTTTRSDRPTGGGPISRARAWRGRPRRWRCIAPT